MWFFRQKQSKDRAGHDRLATLLAGRIITWQRKVSGQLNQKANRYSKATQVRWFWIFCGLATIAMICSLCLTNRTSTLPPIRNSVSTVHIGQSSEGLPRPYQLKSTDSLNHQK